MHGMNFKADIGCYTNATQMIYGLEQTTDSSADTAGPWQTEAGFASNAMNATNVRIASSSQ